MFLCTADKFNGFVVGTNRLKTDLYIPSPRETKSRIDSFVISTIFSLKIENQGLVLGATSVIGRWQMAGRHLQS